MPRLYAFALIASLSLAAHGRETPPGNPYLGLDVAGPWDFGGTLGYRAASGWTLALESHRREEIAWTRSPSESYGMVTLQGGLIARAGEIDRPGFEVGLLAGGGYVRGRIRGKLLQYDPRECDMWCTGPFSSYDTLRLDDPVAVAVVMAGYQGRTFGIGLAPHMYHSRRFFVRVPFTLRIRF